MAQYGIILEEYDPIKENIYIHFSLYFNHPKMVKIKDIDMYSIYMSKMYCLLGTQCRYLIAIIIKDNEIKGHQEILKDLRWTSFQTRTLTDNHDLPCHGYEPTRNTILNKPIERIEITENISKYICQDLNLEVSLLHTNDAGPTQYQPKGTLLNALETYQTIINFID